MARVGITYEQVAAVAERLVGLGNPEPGARAVRDELAKQTRTGEVGSPNTIQRHLVAWRKNRPIALAESKVLPSQLAGDLAKALTAAGDVAREGVSAQLTQLQSEQDDLIAAAERTEALLEQASQALQERTVQRDELQGALQAAQEEAATLRLELKDEREACSAALQQLSAARANEASIERRLAEHRTIESTLAQAQERANQSEQRAVSAEARLQGEIQLRQMVQARLAELESSMETLTAAALRTATAEGAITALQDQINLLTETNGLLKSMVKAAGGLSG